MNQNNTIIFVILGDIATYRRPSFNERDVCKYTNYSFSSYAVLIKRLALKLGLKSDHIGIFAKGNNNYFNIAPIHPDNKVFVQPTIDEIYETKCLESELNFIPFQECSDLTNISIRKFLKKSKCQKPNIILFMFDHGDTNCFGNLKFLDLYIRLMEVEHSSLRIFIDSCQSKCMISKVKNFNSIHRIIASFSPKLSSLEVFFLATVGNELYPEGNYNQWDEIESLSNRYCELLPTDDDYYIDLLDKVSGQDIPESSPLCKDFTNEDINSLAKIIICFNLQYPSDLKSYRIIHSIFIKGIRVMKAILLNIGCTNAQFMEILNDLKNTEPSFLDCDWKEPKNHFIIASSDDRGFSPTFEPFNIKKGEKIIAGAPAMGAYIIAVLMHKLVDSNSIKIIEKYVYGEYQDLIFEFAVPHFTLGKKVKNYMRLNINYWESESNSQENFLFNQDAINQEINIENIMKSIDFRLAEKCTLRFKDNICITPRMQPILKSKKIHYIGIRLCTKEQEYDFGIPHLVVDEYYSEDNSEPIHTQDDGNHPGYDSLHSPTTTPDSSLEKLDDIDSDIDYDQPIAPSYLDKIRHDILGLDEMFFPQAFFEVFKYKLAEITENQNFINKFKCSNSNVPNAIPMDVRSLMVNWIDYFLPSYYLEYLANDTMLLFYQFEKKYCIPNEYTKNIFYKCMNVADQVSSQLSVYDKKIAYNPSRLRL